MWGAEGGTLAAMCVCVCVEGCVWGVGRMYLSGDVCVWIGVWGVGGMYLSGDVSVWRGACGMEGAEGGTVAAM